MGSMEPLAFIPHTSYLIPLIPNPERRTRNTKLGIGNCGGGADDVLALGGLRDGVPFIEPGARHGETGLKQNAVPLGHRLLILRFFLRGLNPVTLAGVAEIEPADGGQQLAVDNFGGVPGHGHDAVGAHALVNDAQGLGATVPGVGGEGLAFDENVDQLVGGIEQGLMGAAGGMLEIGLELELRAGGEGSPGGAAHAFEHLLDFVDGHLTRVGIIEGQPEGHPENLRVTKEPFPGEVAGRPPESQDAQKGAADGMTALLFAQGDEEFVGREGQEPALEGLSRRSVKWLNR